MRLSIRPRPRDGRADARDGGGGAIMPLHGLPAPGHRLPPQRKRLMNVWTTLPPTRSMILLGPRGVVFR